MGNFGPLLMGQFYKHDFNYCSFGSFLSRRSPEPLNLGVFASPTEALLVSMS